MNATPDPVTIGNMLERQVPLEWFEGVALVAGLCSALGDSDSPFIPKPDDVVVTPEGTIVVRGGAADDIAVLARLLSALLDGASPPAPLRLFVLHAVSSNSYRTPRDFGSALAYYERPNQSELLQSAYTKFLEAPAVPPPQPVEPIEREEAAAEPMPQKAPTRHARRWIAGVAVAVACVVVIVLTMMTSRPTLSALAESVGVSDTAPEFAGAVSSPDAPGASEPVPASGTRGRRRQPSTVRSEATGNKPGAPREYISWTPETPSTAAGAASAAPTTLYAAVHPILAPDPAIYGAETENIEPPVLRAPERLPSSVHVVTGDAAHAIEIVVLESGAVGRVNLLTPSGKMTDMMLLSAAKTWTFEPATKDGQPVKYRLLLNWATFR
jgi:hypothetical protein